MLPKIMLSFTELFDGFLARNINLEIQSHIMYHKMYRIMGSGLFKIWLERDLSQ